MTRVANSVWVVPAPFAAIFPNTNVGPIPAIAPKIWMKSRTLKSFTVQVVGLGEVFGLPDSSSVLPLEPTEGGMAQMAGSHQRPLVLEPVEHPGTRRDRRGRVGVETMHPSGFGGRPEGVKIDNYALMAVLQVCDNRIVALLDKYGVPTFKDAVEEMLDRMETNVRAQLAGVPDGTYYGESATDDDGTVLDELVWVRCEATIKGDELILDFSKSDAQRRGFVNRVYSSTYSRAVAGSFLYFDPAYSEFHNEGSMRPITVIAQEGSVCNAQYPATVGGSPVNVGTQVLEATVNALSKAMPDKAIAGWGRRRGHYIAGVDPRTGERYVQTTTDADGGTGAVWGYDGFEGAMGMSGLGSIRRGSVEEIEIRFPWRAVRYHYVPDMSGAGRWRGGSGMLWEVENIGGDVGVATGSSDGDLTQPPGAVGGEDGPLSHMYIRSGDEVVPARTHRMVQVKSGEILGR